SSRRRHTRFSRDWSSDVCSSDLAALDAGKKALQAGPLAVQLGGAGTDVVLPHQPLDATPPHGLALLAQGGMHTRAAVGPVAVPRSEERRVGHGGRARCAAWRYET